jgi:predicted RNase H-like HicB family nuclease
MMTIENYKIVLSCQEDGAWLAEIPSITGCYAIMPNHEEALRELVRVFEVIAAEYRLKGLDLPTDNTQVVRVMRRGA